MVGAPGEDPESVGERDNGRSFGPVLEASARSIVIDVRRSLTDPELSDPERVHEVRKALKRWRAWLRNPDLEACRAAWSDSILPALDRIPSARVTAAVVQSPRPRSGSTLVVTRLDSSVAETGVLGPTW